MRTFQPVNSFTFGESFVFGFEDTETTAAVRFQPPMITQKDLKLM